MRTRAVLWLLVGVAACRSDQIVMPSVEVSIPAVPVLRRSAPRIRSVDVQANPANVLSVLVTTTVLFADSVSVFYRASGETGDSVAPAVTMAADTALVPVLGLLPGTTYSLRIAAHGAEILFSDTVTFVTGPLPEDLPQYVASGSHPLPGYVVFGSGRYGVVIDNSGRVVWYRRFPDGVGLNFQPQATGRYTARPPTPDPTDLEPWVEIDPLGQVTRTLGCVHGLAARLHDAILEPDGSYWLMCDETRVMDLSSRGGVTGARVTGTTIQHINATGALLFRWSPFDHFDIADLDPAERTGVNVNWTHGNALDLDAHGSVIVSFRNLSEITKIDTRSGSIIWRMGGVRNQFTFAGAAFPGFSRQHGVRRTAAGDLLLLDNLGNAAGSRAERYVFDEERHQATLVASYGPAAEVIAQLGGTTQDLPEGHTLVSFGTAGRVEEYDASGTIVWQIEGNPGYVFRAQRISSLYRPGAGWPQ